MKDYKRICSIITTGFRPEWGHLDNHLDEFTEDIAQALSPYLGKSYEQKTLVKYINDARQIFIRASMVSESQCKIEFFAKRA